MPNNYIRFNCNLDKKEYERMLKLQKYYSRLFNKKISLTETFILCLQCAYNENNYELSNITLDYDL